MKLDELYQQARKSLTHIIDGDFLLSIHSRMIPPCMGEYVSRLSHQIDYSLLISISLAQKVLANDLNLHFFKRTRALTKGNIN